ncbi:MAG: cysteine desulfurase [Alphaproteobacteria bacterium]|nr:cysteine desulfurase [Alphaproteobacteria bacterium]MDX5370794.1 cysteine desulfurase [Alphaproteobacteria bacterium]MDX5465207.1 cysteine desulfurase [Alphaproteobacteria bacterium]
MSADAALKTPVAFDPLKVRAEFPILAREVYGKPLVYLDNAASAQKPEAVLEAVRRGYAEEYANVHRGLHFLSNRSTERYEAARASIATFLNAERAEEIIFTSGSTDALNLVASSWAEPRIKAGDEIVLTILEHHSNIVPWHYLRERHGAVLKWAPIHDDGSLDVEAFEKLLTDRSKLVAITHMSNALGTILPAKDLIAMAHARGIPVLLDGSQGAVHLRPDVRDLDVDFYAITGHKLYGPSGVGALYAKREHLDAMRPYRGGGEMIREVTTETVTYADPPHRFEAGTPPIVQAIGLGAALDWMMALDWPAAQAHEADLIAYAHDRFREFNWLHPLGTTAEKGAILSFTMDGAHPHDVSTFIDRQGVAVRAGHHCAQPLMDRYDVPATTRASFALYNTRDDVDRLMDALLKCRELFA